MMVGSQKVDSFSSSVVRKKRVVLSDQVLSEGAFPKEAEGRAAGLGFVVEDGNLRGFAACGRHKRATGTLIL